MADVSDGSVTSWVQTGGVWAFAGAVLWELKQLRPVIKEWIDALAKVREEITASAKAHAEVRVVLAGILERERWRDEQGPYREGPHRVARATSLVDPSGAALPRARTGGVPVEIEPEQTPGLGQFMEDIPTLPAPPPVGVRAQTNPLARGGYQVVKRPRGRGSDE